jgi:uncharacterized membrane protein YdjX (TVP38/TMEM64 family)
MDGQRRRGIVRAALALVASLLLILGWMLFPLNLRLQQVQSWIDSFGLWGPAVFIMFYIVAVVLLVPGFILALSAGLAYGLWGIPLALISATSGAGLAFLIARYLARDQVRSLARRRVVLQAVERAVSEGGWKIVGLVRLSPIVPFNLQNYFFGVTSIPFRHYLPATFFGIIPGTLVNVSLAAASNEASVDMVMHPLKLALFGAGLAVSALLYWYIMRRVKAVLLRAEHEFAEL